MLVGRYTVLLDANVMHPSIVRGALLWFAASRLFRPLWSEAILAEWEESLRRRFPDLAADHFQRQRAYMGSFGEALVEGYEPLMPALTLPDPKDVHVLAQRFTAEPMRSSLTTSRIFRSKWLPATVSR